jgi:protein O-GlcNAc transferase
LVSAHRNRAITLHQLKRFDEAADGYRAAIRLDPAHAETISHLLFLKANMCDWLPEQGIAIDALGVTTSAVQPFNLLALDDSAERSFMRSAKWAQARYPGPRVVVGKPPAVRPARLRIGYFSSDFHDHATMWLIGSLFAAHDRDRFEILLFSYGPDRSDAMRDRAMATADAFHDVRNLGDAEIAALARKLGIDIAVDLKGYTQDTRPGIFVQGAAPVQVAWLGYPGSCGGDFIDYLVADPVVAPASHRRFYSEKLISLPHSYQINDDRRPIAAELPDRESLGLPRDGFLFCCFNQNFKISQEVFDSWMRILSKVEGSRLWLMGDNGWAEENLRREAECRGIDPDRLIFADRVSVAAHLARHGRADLFLDSFAYNAHTTASDALWVGVPVVTRRGDGFAARVASSLLETLGVPELITETAEDYEKLALALARDPDRLAAVRQKIEQGRTASSLFDTPRFARHLERGLELAYNRWFEGLAPDHIEVPAY